MQLVRRYFESMAILVMCLAVGLAFGACSDDGGDGGNIRSQESGLLLVQPLNVTFERVDIGESVTREIVISNIHATQPLTLHRITLSAREGGTAQDLRLVDKPANGLVLAAQQDVTLQVEFSAAGRANSAKIEIISSDPTYSRQEPLTIFVDTQSNRPSIGFTPQRVSFPRLPAGQSQEQVLYIRNFGTAPLSIYKVSYSGGSEFSIEAISDEEIILQPYDAVQAEQNPDRYQLGVKVHYQAAGTGGNSGKILVESNDTSGQSGQAERGTHSVDVQADAHAPCIMVDDMTRYFGAVPIGAIHPDVVLVTNCGSQPLVLSGIELRANSADNEFSLDLGDWPINQDGSLGGDITISPGDNDSFRVNYGPVQVGSDTGKLAIISNDPSSPELELDLVGRGSDSVCPEAKVSASVRGVTSSPRPTISAAPLDYVVLDGSTSVDPDGEVVDFEWTTLEVPDGTVAQLGPVSGDINNTDPSKREFRALLAGTYKFGLVVTDNEGTRSCNQAVATVVAIPNEQIHIELTWTNPEDPDETDVNGSDLDLHFVKMGPGKWFEAPYDIYFRNPNRGGGGIWNPESPSLEIDVTDGMGPENTQMDDPVNCQWYAVGVHYYREAFGTAFATVRIYINELLVFEQLHKEMKRGNQFWDVARIHWNQGATPGFHVYPVDDLMPASPNGSAPRVTDDMISSGLCTLGELY